MFQELEQLHLVAARAYGICDNAGYYRAKAVQDLKTSRTKLVFLPPYAPQPQSDRTTMEVAGSLFEPLP